MHDPRFPRLPLLLPSFALIPLLLLYFISLSTSLLISSSRLISFRLFCSSLNPLSTLLASSLHISSFHLPFSTHLVSTLPPISYHLSSRPPASSCSQLFSSVTFIFSSSLLRSSPFPPVLSPRPVFYQSPLFLFFYHRCSPSSPERDPREQ